MVTVIKPGARERDREREDCLDPSGPHLETVMAPRLQPIRVKRVKRVLEAFSQTKSHLHSEQSHSVPVILHLPPLWFSLTYIKRSWSHFPLCMCTAHSQIFVSMCVHSRFFFFYVFVYSCLLIYLLCILLPGSSLSTFSELHMKAQAR